MPDKPWKVFERDIAKTFGTTRRLMKGTGEKADIGADDFPLCLDCKLQQKPKWSLLAWYKEVQKFAVEASKVAVLVVRAPGSRKKYALIDSGYLLRLIAEFNYGQLFYIIRYDPAGKWDIESWYGATARDADKWKDTLKIPAIIVSRPGGLELMVMAPGHLASLLKGCGVIGDSKQMRELSMPAQKAVGLREMYQVWESVMSEEMRREFRERHLRNKNASVD